MQDAARVFAQGGRLLALAGEHYGTDILCRGNLIRVKGSEEKVYKSLSVIEEILSDAKRGIRVSERQMLLIMKLFDEGKMELLHEMKEDIINLTRNGEAVRPRTLGQKMYVDAIRRIILVRPAVEAGEKLGFLPGDMQEKVNPYLRPLFDGLLDMFGPEEFIRLQQKGQIEVAPLAYMRGRTLEKSFVILDEAQNTTVEQLKMFLTRLGDRSKMVINGDVTQIDLPPHVKSGLIDAQRVLANVSDIESVIFTEDDVVRHDLVAAIIHAYEEDTKKKRQGVEDNGNHD